MFCPRPIAFCPQFRPFFIRWHTPTDVPVPRCSVVCTKQSGPIVHLAIVTIGIIPCKSTFRAITPFISCPIIIVIFKRRFPPGHKRAVILRTDGTHIANGPLNRQAQIHEAVIAGQVINCNRTFIRFTTINCRDGDNSRSCLMSRYSL